MLINSGRAQENIPPRSRFPRIIEAAAMWWWGLAWVSDKLEKRCGARQSETRSGSALEHATKRVAAITPPRALVVLRLLLNSPRKTPWFWPYLTIHFLANAYIRSAETGKILKLAVLGLLLHISAEAHLLNMTRVAVDLDPVGQTLLIRAEIDLTRALGSSEPYIDLSRLPPDQATPMTFPQLEAIFAKINLQMGGMRIDPQVERFTLPTMAPEEFRKPYAAPMTWVWLTAPMPAAEGSLVISTEPDIPIEFPLALTIGIPAEGRTMTRWLEAGQSSQPFLIARAPETAELARVTEQEGGRTPVAYSPSSPVDAGEEVPEDSWLDIALTYLRLGIAHIIPLGLDHILFVLGLFLLTIRWKPLLLQITCFTIAHSLTLALSVFGLISLPASIVEPLIALSIVYVGIENIWLARLSRFRLSVVFLFGLLHGMGFARVLVDLGLPSGEFLISLLCFNIGVEIGQIAVLALAFLVLGWFRNRSGFRSFVLIPASAAISCVALYWTVERIL